MNSGHAILYLLTRFGGAFLEAAPVPFLLYAPFTGTQLRMKRKKLLLFLEIIIFTGSLVRTVCADIAHRWITDGMPALLWLVMTAVYALSFHGIVRGRVFNYLLSVQYILYSYTASEIASKFLTNEFWNFLPYMFCAVTIAPAVCYLLRSRGFYELKGEHTKMLHLTTAASAELVVLHAVALAALTEIERLAGGGKATILLTILIACFMLAGVTAYGIFFSYLDIEEEKERICTQLIAAEAQAKYEAGKMSEERRRRHNMRHHIRMLTSLMENQRYSEMEEYLRKYLKEWEFSAYRPVTSNPMFNAIMSYYINQADKSGIRVRINVEIQEQYAFEYIDMTVLLGNALENAVKACELSGAHSPFIHINMFQIKHQLLIQIENSCKEVEEMSDVRKKGSSKQETCIGYGMRSMRKIVEKYGGDMEYWKTENTFILRIIMHIPDADKSNMRVE